MLEDTLLLLRYKCGSKDALRRIYVKYRIFLLKMASALLHDAAAAEDVVHDVFLRFAQSSDKISMNGSLKAFLRVCVLNAAREKVRKDKVRCSIALDQLDPPAGNYKQPDHWVVFAEDSKRVLDALAKIPLEQREAIVLHLHGDMTFRQIAKLHAVPTATVQSRYRYGLEKLRSILNVEVHQ